MLKIIKKIFYSEFGAILVSIILGLGFASLFKKPCKDKKCIEFKGPPLEDITNTIYQYDNECFTYNEKSIKCGSKEKTIDFA